MNLDGDYLKYTPKCMVCGEPAPFFSQESEPVCLRADCRLVLSKKKHLSESSYNQYFSLQSAQIKKTIAHAALTKKRLAAKKKTENKENISCWEKAINPDFGYEPDWYPYTVIPDNSKKITRLPQKRKTLFRKTLGCLISESLSEDAESIQKTTMRTSSIEDPSSFERTACSICSGGCCGIGEEHAFLKKETIFYYMSGHPDQTPAQVQALYMRYLPEASFENSCVYHTQTGCALPRDMRSHVCNNYLCDSLIKLQKRLTQTPLPKGIFFISRAQDNWKKDDPDEDNPIVGSVLISSDDHADFRVP